MAGSAYMGCRHVSMYSGKRAGLQAQLQGRLVSFKAQRAVCLR